MVRNLVKIRPTYEFLISWLMIAGIVQKIVHTHTHTCTCWLWKRSVIMDDWRWQLQTDWFWWTTAAAVLAINYKQYTVSVLTNLMFVCWNGQRIMIGTSSEDVSDINSLTGLIQGQRVPYGPWNLKNYVIDFNHTLAYINTRNTHFEGS